MRANPRLSVKCFPGYKTTTELATLLSTSGRQLKSSDISKFADRERIKMRRRPISRFSDYKILNIHAVDFVTEWANYFHVPAGVLAELGIPRQEELVEEDSLTA